MVFFNGDRICARPTRNRHKDLEFGKIQEYIDVEDNSGAESDELANYGDVLSSDDTLFSSTCVPSPPASCKGKSLKRIPLLHLVGPQKSTRKASSLASLLGIENGNVSDLPMISPVVVKKSKSQPDMKAYHEEQSQVKIKRQIVWDNYDKPETDVFGEQDERLYRVVDRKFVVGQQVTQQGRQGFVVEVVPFATVNVPFCTPENKHESGHVIPDLNVSEILPISPIFCGVTVEFNGWLGLVTDVQRRAVYKLEDSTYVTRIFADSGVNSRFKSRNAQKAELHVQSQYSYPFTSTSAVPFTGKVEKFTKEQVNKLRLEEEANKENNGYSTRSKASSNTLLASPSVEVRRKSRTDQEDFITAIVESVSIQSIKVRWTGRLPAYLIKQKKREAATETEDKATKRATTQQARNSSKLDHDHQPEMPSTFIRSPLDIKKVRPLYIHPALYFEKKGLCVYKTEKKAEEIMIPTKKWALDLFSGFPELVAPFNLSTVTLSPCERKDSQKKNSHVSPSADDYGKGKRKRCHDEDTTQQSEESGRGVIVCKHFVRHMYKVIWEEKKHSNKRVPSSGMYWGTELHPSRQEHKLCLGLIHSHLYVVPRVGTCMHGRCDYGIVVQKPDDNSVVVEWFKIEPSGSVRPVRTLKHNLCEVNKHSRFNELHEGRVVFKGRNADRFKGAIREFSFGTIVRVNRFALGQISVYCPLQEKIIELWPHMVELFVGMSMQELIAYKVVGQNKYKFQELSDPYSS